MIDFEKWFPSAHWGFEKTQEQLRLIASKLDSPSLATDVSPTLFGESVRGALAYIIDARKGDTPPEQILCEFLESFWKAG
mgnify:CR=1 FL=1